MIDEVEITAKLQNKFLGLLNRKNPDAVEEGNQSEEDFIQDHYFNMHVETLAESSSPFLKRKANKMMVR